ncbi:hypothetical protein [Microbulbifer magnicolonia]|uniref:hypothetical protein n=1 Tax=Microbulbifer magnicolonia TaxID=3109744 RepID=UPI002B412403|nr:hypothetical protein [Microbulbifer sp. GG15]
MRSISKILFATLLTTVLGGCTSHPLMNLQDRTIPNRLDGSVQTQDSVKKGIIAGCIDKGWTCQEVSPGLIAATINVRKHRAVANIAYNADSYSISYKDSQMLDYNSRRNTIHRNYNRWINNLSISIEKELLNPHSVLSKKGTATQVGKVYIAGVGDAVLRLNKQRELENILGGSDWFGRTTSEGFTELRFAGIDKNGNAVFFRNGLQIETNETTSSRTPISTTSGSANTNISKKPSGLTANTTFRSTTTHPASDYHVFVPENSIPITATKEDPRVIIEGYIVEILKASPNAVRFKISRVE